jgi:ornithine--oxo-acid transaminase
LLPGCDAVPFGDSDALQRELERGDVAAFVVEPVQGKGVNIPSADYLPAAQRLCRGHGALLVCDEVQTGLGRTGRFLAGEHWRVEPDLICLSKALSGGLVPIGAVLVSRDAFDRVFDGMERAVRHGSTFGGNDLAAAAALATLRVLDSEGLVERAERSGQLLMELTTPLRDRYEVVTDVRGLGLMWAIELDPVRRRTDGNGAGSSDGNGAGNGAATARRRGALAGWGRIERAQPGLFSQMVTVPLFSDHRILCQVAGHHMNVIKALPALVIEEAEIRRFAAALEEVIDGAARASAVGAIARFGVGVARRRAVRAR